MGYIKKPAGINFVVDPTPLTTAEGKKIGGITAYYKTTGLKSESKNKLNNFVQQLQERKKH